MDEIDYSRFLYRPIKDEPPQKPKRNREEKKPGKTRKIFTVIIVTVICFALLFLCVDFFSKGKIRDVLLSAIKSRSYSFYAVVRSFPTRDMAHAGVLLAENGGGAGYLFTENSNFIVIYGIYSDKTEAETVAKKDNLYYVYTLTIKTSNTELGKLLDEFFKETNVCLNNVDGGNFTESSLSTLKDGYLVRFSAIKTKNDKERSLVSFIVSCLNSLNVGTTERTALLFQTRHMLCSILFSAKDAFS